MMKTHWSLTCVLPLLALALVPSPGRSVEATRDTKLPRPVRKAFEARFPEAEIFKVDVEVENGVTVYDLEFKDGEIEKETDITDAGIMLEFTVVVDAKAVPAA